MKVGLIKYMQTEDMCSSIPYFGVLSVFNREDIVISKGKGNFEAFSHCQNPVFFLLKAKCA